MRDQSVAIALDVARRKKRDEGGSNEAPHVRTHKFHSGPIHSSVAGRTDHLPITVESGSYVLPADCVSHLGENNTLAGFKVLRRMFGGEPYAQASHPYGQSGGPYGSPMARATGGKVDQNNNPSSVSRRKFSTISQVKDAIRDNKNLFYVRWSRDPKHDLKKGARSRDYQTGEVHAGLSARDITHDMPDHKLASALSEYGSPGLSPHIYSGTPVGADSDGYPSISNLTHVGSLSPDLVKNMRTGLARWLKLRYEIQDGQDRLQKITDPFAKQILQFSVENSKKELAEMPDFGGQESQSTSDSIPKAAGGSVHRAAGILFVSPEKEVLLMRRAGKDHAGEWALPAGGLEKDETPEQAARRETEEEAGHSHEGGLSPFMHSQREGVVFDTFLAQSRDKFTPRLNDEHDGAIWIKPAEAKATLRLHPGVRTALDRLDQRRGKAHGGEASGVPIVAAGGEWVISPHHVEQVGAGDMDRGHRVLDAFVLKLRKEHIEKLKKMEPPRRD